MARISVVGTGYVGLVTGACFADLGNNVTCIDIDVSKIDNLKRGVLPIFEPGLEEIVERNSRAGRLRFTSSYEEGIPGADIVFIAVNTPSGSEGEADLKYTRAAAQSIAKHINRHTIIVNKSTVPIGTGDWVANIARKHIRPGASFAVVSNPEFLREGSAVNDFTHPDRVVLGSTDRQSALKVAELYRQLNCPVLITDLRTAEMIKYASNAFLATKISFINEIASICEKLGADVKMVAQGMGLDKRIGHAFLDAGLGFGGSCFPKDVRALSHMAAINGCHPQLLRTVLEINRDARRAVIQKARDAMGGLADRVVGVLGLAFKPNTDDLREAPSLEIIHLLQAEGATVKAYDPVAAEGAQRANPELILCKNAYEVAEGAECLILVTEWNEFKHLDMGRIKQLMASPLLIDGRNVWDPSEMESLGFRYLGVGRPQGADHDGIFYPVSLKVTRSTSM
ncbi:MAG: UDP-glucose dehydrogenase family protein [Sphingomonadaceae bacterium]